MKQVYKATVLLLLYSVLSGCVQSYPTRSGFLTDYSHLRPIYSGCRPIGRDETRFVRSAAPRALENIDSFYIEPVRWVADDLGQPASTPENAERIRHALEISIANELGTIRPIVSTVGPHTARVRAAVTGVQESKPIMNLVTFILTGPLFNGSATAEIEVIDPCGVQIAAESIAKRGKEWDLLGFFQRSRHSESALQQVAEQLAKDVQLGDGMCEAHESSTKR